MCEDARAKRCVRKGASEMLRRRNNLNRTFAGSDTSHFAYFEVQTRTFRISHISQVRNRTLRSFAGDTSQFRTRTLRRQTLSLRECLAATMACLHRKCACALGSFGPAAFRGLDEAC